MIALLIVLRGPAVQLSGPGLDPPAIAVAAAYLPLLAPILLLAALSGLMSAVFQIEERFTPIAIAWTVGPIASFVITVAGWSTLGLDAFALGLTVNAAGTLAVLVGLAISAGILPRPALRAPRDQIVDFGRHMIPLTISASVLQFNLLTDRAIASLLVSGAVSALRYGENIVKLPLNTLGPAWSKAIYPALVLRAAGHGGSSLGDASHQSLRYVVAIFIPVSVATAALAPILIDVAYRRGAFGDEAASLTAGTLAGFAPLIVLTMAQSVLVSAHNARRRGVLLMSMGFANAIMNLVFNVLFARQIGVAGVALSSSVTLAIALFAMAWRLDRLEPDFRGRALLGVTTRATVASALAAIPVALIAWQAAPSGEPVAGVLSLVGLTLLGAALYGVFAFVVGLREPREIAFAGVRFLRRRAAATP
jgi:putative peptidoglycan lipid II flippase